MADKLLAEWFWTDRWMGSSAFLLPIEPRGLYREMLTQAWRRGASLPKDPCAIQRACGVTPEEWARCWPAVKRYWIVDGESIYNDTQRLVYAETVARHKGYSAKASKAAAHRWGRGENASSNASGTAQALPEQCPPSPSPSPISGSERDAPTEHLARAPRKRAAPRKDGDPRINSLKTAWLALYATATGEQPPVFGHAAWGRLCKAALKALDEPAILHRANVFFGSERARMQAFRFEAFFKELSTFNGTSARRPVFGQLDDVNRRILRDAFPEVNP